MTIARLYADWLCKYKEDKDRDPLRLYLSDLGKCPRQIQYRMQQAKADPVSEQERVNKELMFRLAELIETDVTGTFAEAEKLWSFQGPVEIVDRENWGGRYDLIADYNGKRIIEVKTIHPNAFRYDLDYPTHHYQAWAYHHYLAEVEKLEEYPLLVYFDRGGQNTSQEVVVQPQPIVYLMDELDEARHTAFHDDMWPKLPKVLKVRESGKSIKLEPDSRCRTPYCEYFTTCKPDTSTECWAKRSDKRALWEPTSKADPEKMEAFVNTLLEETF